MGVFAIITGVVAVAGTLLSAIGQAQGVKSDITQYKQEKSASPPSQSQEKK